MAADPREVGMEGIVVRYAYSGDEAAWRSVIDAFLDALAADDAVRGRFHYAVTIGKDETSRVHVGRWDSEETLATVQSRDYFKTFADAVQKLGGESLAPMRMSVYRSTD